MKDESKMENKMSDKISEDKKATNSAPMSPSDALFAVVGAGKTTFRELASTIGQTGKKKGDKAQIINRKLEEGK